MRGKWCIYSGARRAAPKIELADGLQPQTDQGGHTEIHELGWA